MCRFRNIKNLINGNQTLTCKIKLINALGYLNLNEWNLIGRAFKSQTIDATCTSLLCFNNQEQTHFYVSS
jgi:hypothetical protein